jgi:hypothetical protein
MASSIPTASDRGSRLREEITRRLQLRAGVETNPNRMAAALKVCRDDRVTFVSDWCWTNDPRNVSLGMPTTIPFSLRPRKAEFIRWLREREERQEHALIEKSRDEGMTWLMCAYMLHAWLFQPGFSGAIGSRKVDLVDKSGDPDAIFSKVRFLLEHLPPWFLPAGFNRREHDNYLRLSNPETGASIKGEGGDNMGRGGRSSLYFIDEWAFVERPEMVNAAVSQNSNVVIKGSTPNGVGNLMYVERFSGRFPVFTFHWRDNPDKNHSIPGSDGKPVFPWYEQQKRNLDPVSLAQEVDIDYTASAEGILIPAAWVQAAINAPIEAGSVRSSGLDVSGDGNDKTVYVHRRGGRVTRLQALTGRVDEKASKAIDLSLEDEASTLYYDRLGVGEGVTAIVKRREQALPFQVVGLANSETPTRRVFEDQPKVPARERFANYGAELAWSLRLRFKATYERVNGIAEHPDDDCVSIPNNPTLIAQMSQPTFAKNSRDKIVIDKKGKGSASPDHFEAVMYAFAADQSPKLTWGR